MFRAFQRLIGIGARVLQLSLELEHAPPGTAHDLKRRLVARGLNDRYSFRLTDNHSVVISFRDAEVRVHRGYLGAPEHVLDAIVEFVQSGSGRSRSDARRELLAYRLPHSEKPRRARRAIRERTHPADERFARELKQHHTDLNASKFSGELGDIRIRVSRRMKSRLGHYSWRQPDGSGSEIAIGSRHIRRDGWDEAVHTLLHEMVHQWQDERGLKVDHGREFRAKARAIGIAAKARRDVA